MGSCITTIKVLPNENNQSHRQQKRCPEAEMSRRPSHIEKSSEKRDVAQLVEQRDKLSAISTTLEQLKLKLQTQSKELIKKHKRGRSLFALKRLRLYTNLMEDVQNQIEVVGKTILGQQQPPIDTQQVSSDILILLGEIREILKLESPLHEKETLKDREEKFKPLFKKYHIQNTDVYYQFAEYEAEVNDITLTTSTVFKKSEAEESSPPGSLTSLGSEVPTQPSSQNNLDEGFQSSEIKVC